MIKKNIIIGTANFGQKYGYAKKKIPIKELNKIINDCKKRKILSLDTAYNYGNTEEILGKFDISNFYIYSKIPKLPPKIKNIEKWIFDKFFSSLKKLKIKKIKGIYLHDEKDLIRKNKKKVYSSICKLKKHGYVDKIGISIYNFDNLEKILNEFKIDILQVPINLFDRRLLNKRILKLIKNKKVDVIARSIFLQGTLLQGKDKIDHRFKKKDEVVFNSWHKWIGSNKKAQLDVCISFIKNIKIVKNVVVGISNLNELRMILKSLKKNTKYPKNIYSVKKELIDLRKW